MCGPCCDYDRMKTDEILYIHTAKVVLPKKKQIFQTIQKLHNKANCIYCITHAKLSSLYPICVVLFIYGWDSN